MPYEELDQEGKAANVAAAARIPDILALVGFHVEEGEADAKQEGDILGFLKNRLEFLAEAEHNGWMMQKRREGGWTGSSVRDNVARRHLSFVSYAELPEVQKEKDRRTIINYPKYARASGFKIVAPSER
jgi:hypothetical protein